MTGVRFTSIPQTRTDDHLPFVLGPLSTDPHLSLRGLQLRRGESFAFLDLPVSPELSIRGSLLVHGDNSFLAAHTSPGLTEWWSLLAQAPNEGPSTLPLLGAGVRGHSVSAVSSDGTKIKIRITPPVAESGIAVAAAIGLRGAITEDNLLSACHYLPGVAACALQLMLEYRELVGTSDSVVEFEDGSTCPEDALLDACGELAALIDWTVG